MTHGDTLDGDLADLRTEFAGSGFTFGSVWASAATGPDARRLYARPVDSLPVPPHAGAVPDHCLGVPLGWESGRERRRQTTEGGLRRQAGQRVRPQGAPFPHVTGGGSADGVRVVCGQGPAPLTE